MIKIIVHSKMQAPFLNNIEYANKRRKQGVSLYIIIMNPMPFIE